jgi:hypothetical protein
MRQDQLHAYGGYWLWTLHPAFGVCLAGNVVLLGLGCKDMARLANGNLTGPGVQAWSGATLALKAEAHFWVCFAGG